MVVWFPRIHRNPTLNALAVLEATLEAALYAKLEATTTEDPLTTTLELTLIAETVDTPARL